MSIRKILFLYTNLFIKSWKPSPATEGKTAWLYRIVVLTLVWLVLLSVQLFNGFFLALDHILFPKFSSIRVGSPLFIVGVPRSGTTFLHRLLALDHCRFTTFSLAELLFAPAISQKLIWLFIGKLDDQFGGWLQKGLHRLDRIILSGLDDVHQTGLWAPEEDYLGLIPVLGCFLLILPFPVPEIWRLAYFDRDLDESEKKRILRAYERLIQRHLYVKGDDRVLLSKNPSFTPMICALSDYFPDAKFIACFRNPTKSIPSQINSILIGARIFHGKVNVDYWRHNLSAMLQFYYKHLLTELPQFPDQNWSVSVMEDLVKDPKTMVLDLYDTLGFIPSAAYVAKLEQEQIKAKSYRSQHHYSLKNLAISEHQLCNDFRFVYEEFNYPLPKITE